jgi:TPR repeat protein
MKAPHETRLGNNRIGFISASLLLICFSSVSAKEVTECDLLAAHPGDSQKVSAGVEISDLNVDKAIRACIQATGQHPNEPRLMYQYGRALYAKKSYQDALVMYREAAEKKYTAAFNSIGYLYQYGFGVEKDAAQAVKWYRKGADGGHAGAMTNLGFMYQEGLGVEKDPAQAVKWFRQAASNGDAVAMSNLGFMYENGEGVEKDYAKAVKWYRKGAVGGEATAMSGLGYMYENGLGVSKEYSKAAAWYHKAANKGDSYAAFRMGVFNEKGLGLERNYELAVQWYRLAAKRGIAEAEGAIARAEAAAKAETIAKAEPATKQLAATQPGDSQLTFGSIIVGRTWSCRFSDNRAFTISLYNDGTFRMVSNGIEMSGKGKIVQSNQGKLLDATPAKEKRCQQTNGIWVFTYLKRPLAHLTSGLSTAMGLAPAQAQAEVQVQVQVQVSRRWCQK